MTRSPEIYGELRNFRAGIEGAISFLRRSLGLARCTWRSLPSFKSYAWASVTSCNLLVLARRPLSSWGARRFAGSSRGSASAPLVNGVQSGKFTPNHRPFGTS